MGDIPQMGQKRAFVPFLDVRARPAARPRAVDEVLEVRLVAAGPASFPHDLVVAVEDGVGAIP